MQKIYMTIDEQIDYLESKNLIINNKKFAKKKLMEIGYYKLINAYKIPFKDNKDVDRKFENGVKFEDLYYLYKFDLQLKSIVFEATTNIEINFKSLLSECISSKYGIKNRKYLRPENFAPDTGNPGEYTFANMKKHIKDSIKKQIDNSQPAIKWYNDQYKYFPFWVVVNILTIGSVSRIYSKLKLQDQIEIAKNYKLPHDYLSSFIIHINLVRNICAHNDVLYRYKFINAIPQKVKCVKEKFELLCINKNTKTGRYEKGTNDFLSTLIIFKLLLSKEDFNTFKTKFNGILTTLKKKVSAQYYEKILFEMGLIDTWNLL